MIDLDIEFPGSFWWPAIVKRRDDPKGRGRVKCEVPGRINETQWANPHGIVAGNKRGGVFVPAIGSKCLVHWLQGQIDGTAVYIAGMFHENWMPSGTVIGQDGDLTVWQHDNLRVEFDTRAATAGLRVTNLEETTTEGVRNDQAGDDVVLQFDLATRQLQIKAVTGIEITTTGALRLDGGTVSINGRSVAPGKKPI